VYMCVQLQKPDIHGRVMAILGAGVSASVVRERERDPKEYAWLGCGVCMERLLHCGAWTHVRR